MKHITFVSTEKQHYKNEELIQSKRFVRSFNSNIYDHIKLNENIIPSNLVIYFSSSLKEKFPDDYKDRLFKFSKDGEQHILGIYDYDELDVLYGGKREQNAHLKIIKDKINNFLKKFALVGVSNYSIQYKDINFVTKRYKNDSDNTYMYIQDEKGNFISYDGKKLKKVPRDTMTLKKTYNGHLSSEQLFHYDNYPNLSYSKVIHYITYDIENDMSLDTDNTPEPIISIVAYSNIYNTTFSWLYKHSKDHKVDVNKFDSKVFVFDSEKNMLSHFLKTIKTLDINMLGGWNSAGFDDPYTINRCKKLGLEDQIDETFYKLRKMNMKDHSTVYQSESIILFDYQKYFKMITKTNKPPSWSLDNVSFHLFKDKKLVHEGIQVMWRNNPEKLIEYNIKDVYLTEKINIFAALVVDSRILQQICPQKFDNIYYTSKTIENLVHMHFKQYKFPTKIRRPEDKFKGALVTDPIPGVFHNAAVLDFAGLYPNIIITFNLSPEKILTDVEYDPTTMAIIDGNMYDQREIGIIPELTKYLVSERYKIKDEKKKWDGNSMEFGILNNKEMAFKALVNSIYGVLGYVNFFLYDKRVPSAVTWIDREIMRWSIKEVAKARYKNLFGDTDSVHIELTGATDLDDAIRRGHEMNDIINKSMIPFVKRYTECTKTIENHTLELEFEKLYSVLKLTEAKKRQVGYLSYYKGKKLDPELLSVTGFDSVKNDTPTLFKESLEGLYHQVLRNYDRQDLIEEFVNGVKIKLKNCTVEELVMLKNLSKKVSEYVNTPQHVRAMLNSKSEVARGEKIHMIYVKDKREVLHYNPDLKQEFIIDKEKYFNNFFKEKLKQLDKSLYYQLFERKKKLIDMSEYNFKKRKRKVKPKVKSLL